MLVILATQEAEIRRIAVQGQPRQIILETLAQKNPSHKWAGGVAEGVGPEFKPQYHKKKKKKKGEGRFKKPHSSRDFSLDHLASLCLGHYEAEHCGKSSQAAHLMVARK
jgi:hypothetical protein